MTVKYLNFYFLVITHIFGSSAGIRPQGSSRNTMFAKLNPDNTLAPGLANFWVITRLERVDFPQFIPHNGPFLHVSINDGLDEQFLQGIQGDS